MGWEILIGVVLAIVFISGALIWAFKPGRSPGPRRHDVRSGGDYADPSDGRPGARGRNWGDGDFGGDGGGGAGGD